MCRWGGKVYNVDWFCVIFLFSFWLDCFRDIAVYRHRSDTVVGWVEAGGGAGVVVDGIISVCFARFLDGTFVVLHFYIDFECIGDNGRGMFNWNIVVVGGILNGNCFGCGDFGFTAF